MSNDISSSHAEEPAFALSMGISERYRNSAISSYMQIVQEVIAASHPCFSSVNLDSGFSGLRIMVGTSILQKGIIPITFSIKSMDLYQLF